ncbi:MAG: DUF1566 domain-containing protein [Acidimicrobiaceae bacterium]|nr:DUF1566 domain-containing protein [Acidimicrobiaceae bacterium]
MSNLRRWWLLCGAVLVGVVALNGVVNGVVDAKAVPAPRTVCARGGATATDGVSGRALVCVQTKVRGLRWRFQPTAVTTTTTTTVPTTVRTALPTTVLGVVAPVVVSASADDGVRVTVAGMRPDTGVYSLQWVPYGQSFNTYQMARATSASMSVPAGWFACNRTYTFRVFVMQADWQLADGHQTQNVTSHSTPFDVVMPTCPTPAVPTVTCATGGVCIVGDTGPGGGIVFYVSADPFTSTGSDCNTTCRYLEAAPADQSSGIVWATITRKCYVEAGGSNSNNNNCQLFSIYSPLDTPNQADSRTAATAIGKGMANTNRVHFRLTFEGGALTSTYAAGIAYAYANSGKTDWHLPSKDELDQLYINKAEVGGFSSNIYWSSSEVDATSTSYLNFASGYRFGGVTKLSERYVRPVRAF